MNISFSMFSKWQYKLIFLILAVFLLRANFVFAADTCQAGEERLCPNKVPKTVGDKIIIYTCTQQCPATVGSGTWPATCSYDPKLCFPELSYDRLRAIAKGLSCWFASISIPIMIIVILYYGWIAVSSHDPDVLAKTKKSLAWAFIGIIVIFGAYTLIATVASGVGIGDLGFLNGLFVCN